MKWASSDEPVDWNLSQNYDILTDSAEMVPLIRIIKIDIVPTGKDDLGQIQDAKLQILSGPLIRNIQAVANDDFRPDFEPDFELLGCSGVCINGGISFDEPGTQALTDRNNFFLPILSNPNFWPPRDGIITTIYLCGLVLTASTAMVEGHFQRVGVFELIFDAESYSEFMLLLSSNPGTLADEEVYEKILEPDQNGVKQYAITLI